MEITSLFDKLEGLLPILIFVIWAIISAVGAAGGKNKRKPPQNQQQQREAPASRQPSHSSRDSESGGRSTTISDEMNRTLDVLFGNKPAETGHRQTRTEQVRKAQPPVLNNKKKTAQKAGQKSSVKKVTSAAGAANFLERSEPANLNTQKRPSEHAAAVTGFSAREAVKGVVWSEILQPPVSMRG